MQDVFCRMRKKNSKCESSLGEHLCHGKWHWGANPTLDTVYSSVKIVLSANILVKSLARGKKQQQQRRKKKKQFPVPASVELLVNIDRHFGLFLVA